MIYMRALLCLALVIVFIQGAFAVSEANLGITVTYVNNAGAGDMTEAIFLGTENGPVGDTTASIQLTNGGVAITDTVDLEDYDVPGIHITRGENENGSFVDVMAFGNNDPSTDRELIRLELVFENAFVNDVNTNPLGFWKFDGPLDGECGINEENPIESTGNDKYEIIDDNNVHLCSVTVGASDIIRLFYVHQDTTAPEVENVVTEPALPLVTNTIDNNEINVTFQSNEYPLFVSFSLFDENGELVDVQEAVTVEDEFQLPVLYTLPEGLESGIYQLFMNVADQDGNEQVVFVGEIIVDIDPPVVSDILTVPTLPVEIEQGDSEAIVIEFESNEYPIQISFVLRDEENIPVDTQNPVTISDESQLPVSYAVPSSLPIGIYELEMIVSDSLGNVLVLSLGQIIVIENDDNNGGGSSGGSDNGEPSVFVSLGNPFEKTIDESVYVPFVGEDSETVQSLEFIKGSESNAHIVVLLFIMLFLCLILIMILLITFTISRQ